MLKRELSDDEIERICSAEKQADRCLETLRLSRLRPEESAWAVLTAAVFQIERARAEFGESSDAYRAAKINLSRYCPMIIRWLGGNRGGCCKENNDQNRLAKIHGNDP